ncbi:SURF1 family protein [Pseudorhodoferax sp.]|uniref:SURF1 family protein n=1 Tax=Pseudorhodoferax sp. TaxID=1993553 RepID=UPI0039E71AFE
MTRRRGLPLLAAAAALLCVLFAALGTWQVQRLSWKKDLIARVQARVHAPPGPPPPAAEWPAVLAAPAGYEYRRLRLQGQFLHEDETLVQAATALGAGYWVLTPLRQADGSLVLVNRGFVPPAARAPDARGAPAPRGEVVVVGLLRISEPRGGFLRENDPAAGRWHSRDVAAIAAARGLPASRVAPYFVDAEAAPAAAGAAQAWPAAGLTVLRFSDNHLVYAVTWYVLAAMVAGAGVALVRSPRRHAG